MKKVILALSSAVILGSVCSALAISEVKAIAEMPKVLTVNVINNEPSGEIKIVSVAHSHELSHRGNAVSASKELVENASIPAHGDVVSQWNYYPSKIIAAFEEPAKEPIGVKVVMIPPGSTTSCTLEAKIQMDGQQQR